MRSMCLVVDSNGKRLVEMDTARPEPGPSEVLIHVRAAGVTTTELGWYPTLHTKAGEPRHSPIPGHEFSGVVEAIGKDVTGVQVCDEVFGMNDWFQNGATAEYCLTIPSSIALKPETVTHIEAASVPIGALTAWQGLFDRAKMQSGEQVFVQGGAGGVGMFAVQLAKCHGAHVVATASPKNFGFVAGLRADEVVDYHGDYFTANAGRFDVVFDVMGGDVLRKSWALLKPGGRMITISSAAEVESDDRVKDAFFIVEPNQAQLARVAELLDDGNLVTEVDHVAEFDQAPDAYAGTLAGRRGRGKVVVAVS